MGGMQHGSCGIAVGRYFATKYLHVKYMVGYFLNKENSCVHVTVPPLNWLKDLHHIVLKIGKQRSIFLVFKCP